MSAQGGARPLGKVFTVCSATGGCGKTFYATNIAYLLSQLPNTRVALTSPVFDPRTGLLIDSRTGFVVQPGTGFLIDPSTGALIDPLTLQSSTSASPSSSASTSAGR